MAIRHSNATVNKFGHRSFGIGSASANPGDHTVSCPNECMELESVQLTACVVRGVRSRLLEHDEPGRTLERIGSHGMREGSSHLTVTYTHHTTPHSRMLPGPDAGAQRAQHHCQDWHHWRHWWVRELECAPPDSSSQVQVPLACTARRHS